MRSLLSLLLLPLVLACSAAPETSVDVSASELALSSFRAGDLRVSLEMKDGIKASTKNNRYVIATFARGTKSFIMWCSTQVKKLGDEWSTSVHCSNDALTLSDDDNEALDVDIVRLEKGKKVSHYLDVWYSGDGTFFGNELEVLGGPDAEHEFGPMMLTGNPGTDPVRDPFALGASLHGTLAGLLGEKVQANGANAPLPVTAYYGELTERMELTSLRLSVNASGSIYRTFQETFSILKTPKDLKSGYATKSTILGRIRNASAAQTFVCPAYKIIDCAPPSSNSACSGAYHAWILKNCTTEFVF